MNLKDILRDKLSKEEMRHLQTSYDIIGDIAIIEIPEEIQAKKMEIARAITKIHKNINKVCMKKGAREGEFRLRGLELLIGDTTKTEHKEHGCRFRLDVAKAYFSPRESTERERISEMASSGETIMVLFAGIGPYSVVLAKKRPDIEKIYSLEINPDAVEYMKENIRINKVQTKVVPILGDAKKDSRPYYGKCDRVIMPLPKQAYEFLEQAFLLLRKKGTIHLYFVDKDDNYEENVLPKLEEASKKTGLKYTITGKRKVLPYGPGTYKLCADISVFE